MSTPYHSSPREKTTHWLDSRLPATSFSDISPAPFKKIKMKSRGSQPIHRQERAAGLPLQEVSTQEKVVSSVNLDEVEIELRRKSLVNLSQRANIVAPAPAQRANVPNDGPGESWSGRQEPHGGSEPGGGGAKASCHPLATRKTLEIRTLRTRTRPTGQT